MRGFETRCSRKDFFKPLCSMLKSVMEEQKAVPWVPAGSSFNLLSGGGDKKVTVIAGKGVTENQGKRR